MIKITLSWWHLRDLAAKHPEDYTRLRELVPVIAPLEEAKNNTDDFEQYVNDTEILAALPATVLSRLEFKAMKPLKLLTEGGSVRSEEIKKLVGVHQVFLPGNELLRISEVDWMEDACTEALQEKLNEGWRILAVCPQSRSRRPDYVLGKLQAEQELRAQLAPTPSTITDLPF